MKRAAFLQPFSREHHHNLLLGWKIRKGFSKNIEPERIKKYTDWFYKTHIDRHFKLEEKYIFPVLGRGNQLVEKALSQHRRLRRLFKDQKNLEKSLSLLEEELEAHVRFEERELFPKVQEKANEAQQKEIENAFEEEGFEENTSDEFWN